MILTVTIQNNNNLSMPKNYSTICMLLEMEVNDEVSKPCFTWNVP